MSSLTFWIPIFRFRFGNLSDNDDDDDDVDDDNDDDDEMMTMMITNLPFSFWEPEW